MMGRLFTRDFWHLEKALTATSMMVVVLLIFAGFVTIGERFGWVAGSVFAAAALSACIWFVIKFVPFSEYRKRKP